MKKLLIVIPFIFALQANAQTAHTDSSLNTMTKMQLANLYLDQVTTLAFTAPYTPFTIGVNDSINGELDIPVSKYIKNKRESVVNISKQYGDTMKEQLYEIVPYADKADMIRAILFLQEMNSNIKK